MAKPPETFVSRWGVIIDDDRGRVMIPGFILAHVAACGMGPKEQAFMTQVMSFKYDLPDSEARPSLAKVADRLGVETITARRYKNKIVELGLLTVEYRTGKPSVYDFRPLTRQCLIHAGYSKQTALEMTYGPGSNAIPDDPAPDNAITINSEPEPDPTPISSEGGTPISSESRIYRSKDIEISPVNFSELTISQKRDQVANAIVESLGIPAEVLTDKFNSQLYPAATTLAKAKARPEHMAGLVEYCRGKSKSKPGNDNFSPFYLAQKWPPYVASLRQRGAWRQPEAEIDTNSAVELPDASAIVTHAGDNDQPQIS